MKTIDPRTESICCPHCSGADVRYNKEAGVWRCRRCSKRFVAEGTSRDEIRLYKEEPRSHHSGAEQ